MRQAITLSPGHGKPRREACLRGESHAVLPGLALAGQISPRPGGRSVFDREMGGLEVEGPRRPFRHPGNGANQIVGPIDVQDRLFAVVRDVQDAKDARVGRFKIRPFEIDRAEPKRGVLGPRLQEGHDREGFRRFKNAFGRLPLQLVSVFFSAADGGAPHGDRRCKTTALSEQEGSMPCGGGRRRSASRHRWRRTGQPPSAKSAHHWRLSCALRMADAIPFQIGPVFKM